uniref:Coiled-coil domain containing 142 n=1 Tax=Geospiza parvula TaxID=87175 RepID=A0A8C3M761_GEOPR
MDAGGAERRGGELCLQVGDAGLGGLILLLLTARPGPGDGAARGDPPEPGGSRGPLARSLQRAEAMLRSVTPGLRRLLSPRSSRRGDTDEDDDEDEDEAASIVVPLEQTFPALLRCLCVWEDPRTETFLGYVRPHPGGGAGDFSEDAVRRRVAERGATLHALLQHRHQLRLARDFTRRLKASSDFLRRLQALPEAGEPARVPAQCREELGRLCLQLLCRGVLCSWDTDFTRALGSGLSDKCLEAPGGSPGPGCSRTAQQLRCLFPALALALRCLRLLPACPHAPPGGLCLRLQVLGRCLAAVAAAHAWLTGRAGRYLAAWALPQFLLLTQGDLQVLKAEAEQLMLQVSRTFPEPGDIPGDSPPEPPPSPGSPWELQLCRQICDVANSIQLFSGDVLWMFSTSCKRLSAEIFDQTMPLGRHWRLGPRAELPSSPSAYAAAAVQAVLGQVLQGAQALPHDAQVPTLARVTTAFLEAWMDHILTRRIKFSLQGALQLRRDFEARELVCSERSGLAPEARQALRALCVFRHTDTAVRCLLQQPGGLGGHPRRWGSLRRCCSDEGAHPLEPSMDPLPGLDPLEGLGPVPGTPPLAAEADGPARPESPFPGSQQQWLSLRLHRARRWRVPGLPCVGNSPEG